MQMKGLNPEIIHRVSSHRRSLGKETIVIKPIRQGFMNLTGSETVARCQKEQVCAQDSQSDSRINVDYKLDESKSQQMTLWQSDYFVVSEKSRNGDGEKGVAGKRWDLRDTTARHRTGVQLSTKLESLTQRAKENSKYKFITLAYLLTEDFLKECFCVLKRESAAGIDGVTVKGYEVNLEKNLKDLVTRLKTKRYRPQPVRRVYIPKADGSKRGLGIPTIEDKIVQMGITRILEAIFEVDFTEVSYGFRPNRSCHVALNVLDKTIMTKPVNYVVDMDIEKFFDNVSHKWMMECLRQRIIDSSLLRLIERFLKAGVMEEGKFIETEKGTPQGGVLSPVLSNIYLHYILDQWFEKKVKKQMKGFSQMIRYCDDFIVCFQIGDEAKTFGEILKERLGKYGLKISENKSRIIEFGRYVWEKAQKTGKQIATFDFLGFTHYCDRTRRDKFKLGSRTADTKFKQKIVAMNQWCKKVRNLIKLQEIWEALKVKLNGHYRYYGISGNMQSIRKFYILTSKLAYKWLNRRSQKKSFTLAEYFNFKQRNPLPEPKIYHLTYTLSSY